MFRLRFKEERIQHWAERYSYASEIEFETKIAPQAKDRGYLTREDLIALGRWKTPRTQPLIRDNPADIVEAITRAALESRSDSVKINALRALNGVSWPTASVVLHFCDQNPYPVLDFRALWSLGHPTPPRYTLDFWLAYTTFTRDLAQRTGHSMRTVDKALWQFSNERQ